MTLALPEPVHSADLTVYQLPGFPILLLVITTVFISLSKGRAKLLPIKTATTVTLSANTSYYNTTTSLVDEEFIFIFDFSQTDGSYIQKDVPMLFNLYQNVGGTTTSKVNVYGNYADQMIYSTYLNDNQLLGETLADYATYIYHNTSNKVNLTTTIAYDKLESGVAIIDTNYNSSAMGLNIKLYDSSNNLIASNKLIGTYFVYDGNNYFADADGVFRIKLTGKVSEISSNYDGIYFICF